MMKSRTYVSWPKDSMSTRRHRRFLSQLPQAQQQDLIFAKSLRNSKQTTELEDRYLTNIERRDKERVRKDKEKDFESEERLSLKLGSTLGNYTETDV